MEVKSPRQFDEGKLPIWAQLRLKNLRRLEDKIDMSLKITLINPITQEEKPIMNYTFKNGCLTIPELGCTYVLSSQLHIDFDKPFYYTDSVFPIDKPKEQIIRKYIKVEIVSSNKKMVMTK